LDALSAELLAVVHQTMQPTTASLWLREAAKPTLTGHLSACMPYTACEHGRCCSRALALVIVRSRLTARYRCCPSLSPPSCPKYAPGPSGL
jgi:hypothetical protein